MQKPPFDYARVEDRLGTVAGAGAKRCALPGKDAENVAPLQTDFFQTDERAVRPNLVSRTAFGRVDAACRNSFVRWHVHCFRAPQGSHTESMGRESRAYGSSLLARSNRMDLPVVPMDAPKAIAERVCKPRHPRSPAQRKINAPF